MKIKKFICNPFKENTYIIFDETKECIIIDPGMANDSEKSVFQSFIESNKLKPTKLINTHCHLDHIVGNNFVIQKYKLKIEARSEECDNVKLADQTADMFNFPQPKSPLPQILLDKVKEIQFGNSKLEIIFVPGHTAGHICLYSQKHQFVITGDVLFKQSIGRTDLPGGNTEQLINGIKEKLLTLDERTTVLPGHMSSTTIGFEKRENPFL